MSSVIPLLQMEIGISYWAYCSPYFWILTGRKWYKHPCLVLAVAWILLLFLLHEAFLTAHYFHTPLQSWLAFAVGVPVYSGIAFYGLSKLKPTKSAVKRKYNLLPVEQE
jgi:hypothetical protein